MAIACFRPDGKLDTAFGNGGTVQVAPGGASLGCFDALPVAGNNLLAAANYTGLTGQPDGIMLVRIQLAAGADMVVRDVAGNVLSGSPDTPPIDLGLVTLGSRSAQFTVRNEGDMPLTDLAVSLTGVSHPGEFSARLFGGSSLAAGGSAEFVVTLTPSAVPGLRTAVLQIANSDRPFSIPLTGLRATPSQMWRLEWFGSPDNSGQGADMNDFDGDGLVNLIEYATGSNPHRPSPQTGQVVKTGDQLEFTYTRSSTALAELTFQPEAAATPAGPWSSVDVMSSVVSEEGGRQTVRVTVPTGSTSRFIRLRITRN